MFCFPTIADVTPATTVFDGLLHRATGTRPPARQRQITMYFYFEKIPSTCIVDKCQFRAGKKKPCRKQGKEVNVSRFKDCLLQGNYNSSEKYVSKQQCKIPAPGTTDYLVQFSTSQFSPVKTMIYWVSFLPLISYNPVYSSTPAFMFYNRITTGFTTWLLLRK
jgi:hypothetical protein